MSDNLTFHDHVIYPAEALHPEEGPSRIGRGFDVRQFIGVAEDGRVVVRLTGDVECELDLFGAQAAIALLADAMMHMTFYYAAAEKYDEDRNI